MGSSPLARGLPQPILAETRHSRIIPARAGFTCTCPSSGTNTWDHPRSRGVYIRWRRRLTGRIGSSPLARGLRPGASGLENRAGIIPARAGFTVTPLAHLTTPPDHPRSRGVYSSNPGCGRHCTGSSPLARGLRSLLGDLQKIFGDHPRSRGVYTSTTWTCEVLPGSSPLARGLRG